MITGGVNLGIPERPSGRNYMARTGNLCVIPVDISFLLSQAVNSNEAARPCKALNPDLLYLLNVVDRSAGQT